MYACYISIRVYYPPHYSVEWYKAHPDRWEDVASAIVAHPRRGWTAEEMHISEASTASSQDAKPSPTAAKE